MSFATSTPTPSGYFSAALGGDVALSTGATDILAVGPLPAGQYEIRAPVQVMGGAFAATVELYVWDPVSTTVYGAIRLVTTAGFPYAATLIVPITLTAPATIHLGGAATTATAVDRSNGGAVHPGPATYLTAQRVA